MKTALGGAAILLLFVSVAGGSPPDDWGYRYASSGGPGGPAFLWRDISLVGQSVLLLDDDNAGPFYLGFEFPFYAESYESLFVCSNGWVSFSSESHQFHHFQIPSDREPDCILSPFWTDLDPTKAGSVLVYQDLGEFVVSWEGVPHRRGLEGFSFQAVVLQDSGILFQYLSMVDSIHVDSSSVGIENEDGSIGLGYFFNGAPDGALRDSLALAFYTVEHDVNPVVIHSPLETHFTSIPCTPAISIKNYGNSSEAPAVMCDISDSATLLPLYSDTVAVPNINPRETLFVSFRDWVPDEGTRLVSFVSELSANSDGSLDTLERYVRVSAHADMSHDDGEADAWYIVSGSPVSIMGLAVRFEPPYSPYRAIRGKILASNTLPFEEVYLAPDDGSGVPDLQNPYCVKEGVRAASDSSWALADFDVTVRSGDDVRLVVIWPRGAVGPLVGEDMSPPVDSCSFYTVYPPMWNARTTGDWMMRVEIDDEVGVEESPGCPVAGMPRLECFPNPFISTTSVIVLGARHIVSLSIHDIAGRVVKSLDVHSDAGVKVSWDGTDDRSARVTSGMYFVTLRIEDTSITKKIIFLK